MHSPDGEEISYAIKFKFQVTNNQVEYEAFITQLKPAHALRAKRIEIQIDSHLVCNQLSEHFQARREKIVLYLKKAKKMIRLFQQVKVQQIARTENYRVDMLARMATMANLKLPKLIPIEVRTSPSIEQETKVMGVDARKPLMDPILSYVRDGSLPVDKKWARKLKCQAARYTLLDGILYCWGFTLPFLRYLDGEEANYVLREIHERVCGNLFGARALAFKELRQGYFGQPCTAM